MSDFVISSVEFAAFNRTWPVDAWLPRTPAGS